MIRVNFTGADGVFHAIDTDPGWSLMQVAVNNNVAGIVAECGGACACATCHVYIAEEDLERTGTVSEVEDVMLEIVEERRPTSRLSCQIQIDHPLDGLTVTAAANG